MQFNKDTLLWRHLSIHKFLHVIQPHKKGHFTNMDTFFCPIGV